MPTYEYRCPNGHEFERFQKITAEPGAACPTCGEMGERLVSGGMGFLFKGDGFYSTDYRSESYKREASKDTETATSAKKVESSGGSSETASGSGKKKDSPSSSKEG